MISIRLFRAAAGPAPRLRAAGPLAAAVLGCALSACAAVSRAPAAAPPRPAAGALAPASAVAPAAASAPPGASQPAAPSAAPVSPQGVTAGAPAQRLDMPAIDRMLRRISAMSQPEANAWQRALQSLGAQRSAAQRLELAYLLIARAAPTPDEAAQAHDLLRRLDNQTTDPAGRQFLRVLQRLSLQTVELAQARAALTKAQRKAADLEDKIGQIKNLEVQLQGRSQDRGGVRRAKPKAPVPSGAAAHEPARRPDS